MTIDRSAIMRPRLTPDIVRELLDYNPETGETVWLPRSLRHFHGARKEADAKMWNKRFAGKPAGSINSKGYAVVFINYRQFVMGRVAWLHFHGQHPNGEIDHIDGNPLNNAISNLREASRSQNAANRRIQSNNTSGYKGVSARGDKWSSSISINGKVISLGLYPTPEEAHAAWRDASRAAFGKFHRSA